MIPLTASVDPAAVQAMLTQGVEGVVSSLNQFSFTYAIFVLAGGVFWWSGWSMQAAEVMGN